MSKEQTSFRPPILTLFRLPPTLDVVGQSRSGWYSDISKQLAPPPITIGGGGRAVGWPDYECYTLAAARVAGWTDIEIRQLVRGLLDLRPRIPALSDTELRSAIRELVAICQRRAGA